MLQLLPRPILKDTSARDRLQRESWMSEPPGITLSGSHTSGVIRPASAFPSSPVAPPKSLARVNSAKRQSKLSRSSTLEHDQDALTPRPRHASFGYGPDYRPRRQSGGPGHLLYGFDATSSNTGFESEDYDDSDMDDTHQHSKQLQEQYSLLQKSHRVVTGSNLSVAGDQSTEGDVPYIAKRGQRKSLGDELDGPPVPEKSVQRKRVSTMGSATLPAVPSALTSALILSNNGSTSDTTLPILRSTSQRQRDRRPYGTVGPNLLSFEPLFALKDFTPSSIKNEEQLLGESKDSGTSRLSAVSDADWYSALLTINLNQQGVSVLDLSKRELTEIPLSLPASITHLRLAYNTIRTLSPMTSLASLNHLQVLDLCDNHLEILPPEIGLLTKLKELYLSNNKLWKLPDNIQKMARLEVLDIRNNQFYLLNPMVGRLKALRQLDVRYNQLKSLPAPLCMVSSTLTVLLADGNNFVSPFLELLQPLMVEDKDSTGSGRQSFLSDDPYADPNSSNVGSVPAKVVSVYEPWRRSITPNSSRRLGGGAPTLTKRRSHGDLMSLMGLQKKDEGASTDDSGSVASGSHMLTSSSGAQVTVSRNAENASTRRERSVSTSTVTHATEMHSDNTTVHPLSFNKLLKSIRKGSRSSMREGSSSSKSETTTKRHSIGNEFDQLGDNDSDLQDTELKQNSKGSSIVRGPSGRRATASGINQWVRDRFQKGTNSTDLGTLTDGNSSAISLSTDKPDGGNEIAVRDSGYGSGVSGSKLGPSLGSTPDLSQTLHQGRGSSIFDIRFQNKSTGHLPHGSPIVPQNAQFSSPIDTSFKKEKDGRHSYISVESQMTQGTDNESEIAEIDAAIAHQFQQQQQHHRLSSVHSPTTPLPSSPIIGGVSTDGNEPRNWNPADPRFGQSAAQLRPLMQYLKDLHDLDPDSSEWEEVYAWRRVWNAERSTATGVGVGTDDINAEDPAVQQEKQAKDEEIRIAKLQAQASRRRRIIDEILSTERTYVEGLKGLVEIYLTPALQIMPPGDHKAVFSNAQAIYTFHADHFLPALEKAYQVAFDAAQRKQDSIAAQAIVGPLSPIPTSDSLASSPGESATAGQVSDISTTSSQPQDASTDSVPGAEDTVTIAPPVAISAEDAIKKAVEDRIGRVFAEHVPYMKMYSFYINNYDNALRVLQTQLTQAKHKKKMKEFLRRCAKHPNHTQLALQGYLLLPVQRIPRYKLLLQDLLENTWADHVDHQDIAMALEKISSRADEMNERKRQYENHEKVLLVQNRIIGQYKTPLVQPHRKVVREGMLHLIRVVTRNVSMGVDKVAPISHSNVPLVGDLTVHHLSEDTVEKSFLFILFNDIMIQCNPLAGKAAGGNNGSNGNSGSNGSSTGSSVNGSGASVGGSSMAGGGSGSGSANSDAGVKNLELCRVLQLESRLHPAEVIGQDVLRVVDDAMVLYLTGDKDVIHAWKEDINSRW
ncbi:hypothetical protein BGZ58_010547 [Dissophora ornata]|nr:hypothetical protein BGZ58_010547 [Dissophora ornata]